MRYPRGGRGRHSNRPPPRPPEEPPASGRTHHHHSAPYPVPTTSARHPLLFVPQLVGVASLVCLLARCSRFPLRQLSWLLNFHLGPDSAISKELGDRGGCRAGRPRGGRGRAYGREARAGARGGWEDYKRVIHAHIERERESARASERASAFGLEGRSRLAFW